MTENWFDTLNEALNSENLIDAWDCFYSPISYGETRRWIWDNDSAYGHVISIYAAIVVGMNVLFIMMLEEMPDD